MATPRKHWFKVEDSILREIESPEDRGIIVGLVAFANQRWARDGLSGEEACRVPLNPADLHLVTGRERARAGLARLRQALGKTSATISQESRTVLVEWPRLLEIQEWAARHSGNCRPTNAPSETQDARRKTQGRKEGPAAPPSAALQAVWTRGVEEAGAILKRRVDWRLTSARQSQLRGLVADFPDLGDDAFRAAVRGFWEHHASWDGRSNNFVPDTLLRASKRAKYIESYLRWNRVRELQAESPEGGEPTGGVVAFLKPEFHGRG